MIPIAALFAAVFVLVITAVELAREKEANRRLVSDNARLHALLEKYNPSSRFYPEVNREPNRNPGL